MRLAFFAPMVRVPKAYINSPHTIRNDLRLQLRRSMAAVLVILASCFLLRDLCRAQVREVKRVLIVNVYNPLASPGVAALDRGIVLGLESSPYQIELYSESLDLTVFPDEAHQQQFRDWYIRKYHNRKPDVIVAVGPEPIRFLAQAHKEAFPGTPIVFCGSTQEMLGELKLDSDFTGTWAVAEPEKTLIAALRLQPETKNVVVVGGTAGFDRYLEKLAKERFGSYESQFDFTYLTDLDMPALLERLKHLPDHTIVYYTSISQDAAGAHLIDATQSVPMVLSAANAPVFVVDDVDFGKGSVGGDLLSWSKGGEEAATLALKVLRGEKPKDIPIVKSANIYMFDWRALKRWGLNEKNLPAGSVVLDRPATFWESYKEYILAGIFVFLTQSFAIFALLWQRRQRRKTEVELRRSEEKFSKAFRRSPLAFTLVSLVDYRFIEVNDTFEQYLGWMREEAIGRTALDLKIWVDTNQRTTFLEKLRAQGAVRNMELLFRKKDGRVWTGLVSCELIDFNGQPCALSLIADITVRKEAEEALADVSRKLVEVQEEERTRIARDLHDDINQRLAMLAVEIQQLNDGPPDSPIELSRRLSEVRERLTEVSTGVQSISHELHSPQLEYLGVVAALKSFCREFASRQSVQVDFRNDDIPESPSNEVSLCLFRVLQEALHNATKYSQARHFEVRLTCAGDQLDLTVADRGIGFDPETALREGGLGLVSMRERVRLANGTIVIDSKPMSGTTIHVRVPFGSQNTSRPVAV